MTYVIREAIGRHLQTLIFMAAGKQIGSAELSGMAIPIRLKYPSVWRARFWLSWVWSWFCGRSDGGNSRLGRHSLGHPPRPIIGDGGAEQVISQPG